MNCVSYDICVYHFWFCLCFFSWGIPPLQSDWSLSCDHELDLASSCQNNNTNTTTNTTTTTTTNHSESETAKNCYSNSRGLPGRRWYARAM